MQVTPTDQPPELTPTLRRELKWFGLYFGLPFVALVGFDLLSRPSPIPLWRRLLSLEDTCTYGICFVLPGLFYAAKRLSQWLRGAN